MRMANKRTIVSNILVALLAALIMGSEAMLIAQNVNGTNYEIDSRQIIYEGKIAVTNTIIFVVYYCIRHANPDS
jgi:hypothetical protein